MEHKLDKLYQTMLILWFAMLMSIAMLLVVALVAGPEPGGEPTNSQGKLLLFVLAGVSIFTVVLSFAVKRKILQLSVEKQDVTLVQKALVLACAMCEVVALLGLVQRFLIGSRDYLLLFLMAAVGIALHFPRRDQLIAASWKDQ